jgi:hypothetical protein
MNRDFLYSLGLALAAWPPIVGKPVELAPVKPRPAIQATVAATGPTCRVERKARPASLGQLPQGAACAQRELGYNPYSSR